VRRARLLGWLRHRRPRRRRGGLRLLTPFAARDAALLAEHFRLRRLGAALHPGHRAFLECIRWR
jgi:hypothetical protein